MTPVFVIASEAKQSHFSTEQNKSVNANVTKNRNELNIKIVPGSGFINEHKYYIENRIREKFDSKIKIKFTEEPFIEREKSGKMRVVKRLFS